MESNELHPLDYSSVAGWLDDVLVTASFDNDAWRKAQIAIAFCELISNALDSSQLDAVAHAKHFWATGDETRHAEMLEEFARKMDADARTKASAHDAAMNRLVFSALSKNTGLTSYAGDFLIGLGADAGVSADQMAQVFSELVPGFVSSRS
ncbi:MAG: hypothetical protein R3F10_12690 [Lysobacteraceae bacterium]